MRALDHDLHMRTALALAEQARLICPPNPAVGCVIVGRDGEVLGQGHTQPVGQAHAEIMALRDAAARGLPVQDATAYVTLEPLMPDMPPMPGFCSPAAGLLPLMPDIPDMPCWPDMPLMPF